MDALKIGSFRGVYYEKCHKTFHSENLNDNNFGVKIHTCFWTKKNLNWLRTHPNRCQVGSARHQFLFHLTQLILGGLGKEFYHIDSAEGHIFGWKVHVQWMAQHNLINDPNCEQSSSQYVTSTFKFSCKLRRSFSATCDGLLLPHSYGTFLWLRITAVTWAPFPAVWDSMVWCQSWSRVLSRKNAKLESGSLVHFSLALMEFTWFLLHRYVIVGDNNV